MINCRWRVVLFLLPFPHCQLIDEGLCVLLRCAPSESPSSISWQCKKLFRNVATRRRIKKHKISQTCFFQRSNTQNTKQLLNMKRHEVSSYLVTNSILGCFSGQTFLCHPLFRGNQVLLRRRSTPSAEKICHPHGFKQRRSRTIYFRTGHLMFRHRVVKFLCVLFTCLLIDEGDSAGTSEATRGRTSSNQLIGGE